VSATKSVDQAQDPAPAGIEDATDLDAVYREHGGWLIAFLRRRFGRQDAEELAQETYVRAAGTGVQLRNPRAFLARVAINAARDQARRRSVRPSLVGDERALGAASTAGGQPEDLLLKQLILGLPPKLREVFLLSRFGGLTYRRRAEPQVVGHVGGGDPGPGRIGAHAKTFAQAVERALERFGPLAGHTGLRRRASGREEPTRSRRRACMTTRI
jgi:RNA polymerase sigma-70 factor (ECF subfamily)